MGNILMAVAGGVLAAAGAVGSLIPATANAWPWVVWVAWAAVAIGLAMLVVGAFLRPFRSPSAARSSATFDMGRGRAKVDIEDVDSTASKVVTGRKPKSLRARRVRHRPGEQDR